MSKKQREKVEEEVSFHQSQNRLRAAGTSPDPWQGPDTTSNPADFSLGQPASQPFTPQHTQYPVSTARRSNNVRL